ncbi:MAG: acyltransferase family protein [Robiginitomaculum sp.]|nr:acyltransferase family protein [Robiginitomaculum sp.]
MILITLGALPFIIYHIWLKPIYPSTHALVDDWANHQLYIMVFLFGFLCAKDANFWRTVDRSFKPALIGVLLISITACLVWHFDMKNSPVYGFNIVEFFSERIRKTLYAWLSILVLLGGAQKWLNRPSRVLSYMTEAIFPWYILHQTIIIMAGYYFTRQGLSVGLEFLLVTLATLVGCWVGHELFIRRWRWIRPLFGLKKAEYPYRNNRPQLEG